MKKLTPRIIMAISFLVIAALACGAPAGDEVSTEAPTEAATEAATEAPTEASAPPAEPDIQHTTIPVSLPEDQNGQAADFDSSNVLENNSLIGGDRFTFGRFERPFNANTMDMYFPQLDIVNTQVHQDDTWIYGSVTLKELQEAGSSDEKYAIELDVTLDGKGDWLVIANKPESTDWTVRTVRVYNDANKDVGGEMPTLTDDPAVTGDGFETLVFEEGVGNDPDTAWVRLSPNDANTIEFSVKKSAIGNPTQFMINMWAGTSLLDAGIFDMNDKFTHEEAGAADAGLEYFYPIKAVSEVDNSCRMAVGFQPNGSEPGICPVPQSVQSAPVPPGTSCPAGTYLICLNGNCFCMPLIFIPPTDPPPVP